MLFRLVLAAFLLAHGAIHAGYISPRPPPGPGAPAWPFALDASWASTALGVDVHVMRAIGTLLVAATLGGFALAALVAVGILPAGVWPVVTAVGAIASIAVLLLFFHPWLLLGVAIDIVLLWAVLAAHWQPEWLTT